MAIRAFIVFLIWIGTNVGHCQNLVPNGSFEVFITCPEQPNQLKLAREWNVPSFGGTPDYFCYCSDSTSFSRLINVPINFAGHQEAFEGRCYAGMFFLSNEDFSQREYIQVKLKEPLRKGTSYRVSMRISLSDKANYPVNFFSACLSKTGSLKIGREFIPICESRIQLGGNSLMTDSTNWIEVVNLYVAGGGETYLTIGIFDELEKSKYRKMISSIVSTLPRFGTNPYLFSYYYIDDVLVIAADEKGEFSHQIQGEQ